MFAKVLFPVIMTEHTEQIVNCVGGLAKNGVKEVLLFHVISISEEMNSNTSRKYDEEILKKWKILLEETGMKVSYKIVTGIPWIEILDTAEKGKFSFIMIGSHGSSFLDRVLIGSVTENVVHHSSRPIFIYKLKKEMGKKEGFFCEDVFSRILYVTDFSETSEKCIPYIQKMMIKTKQKLTILHVQDMRNLKHVAPEKIEEFNKLDLERLDGLRKKFSAFGFKNVMSLLSTGYSISEILNYARTEEATIIVLGRKGKSNIKEMLMGGVAQTIVHKSEVPVFLVEENK
jgi:nucleotide-binding universal stress UspA family protein